MLRAGIIARGLVTTALVLGVGTGVRGQAPAVAQGQPGAAIDPAPPNAAAALDMFAAVADWVKRWQTPMDPMGQPPVHAAAVTLRYEGSIVGRGVAITGEPAGAPGILMLAASRAMNEAKTRLPVPHDALEEENLRALAPMIAITVEIAGRPVPIAPKEWADAVDEIGPGLDGVAVRMGERIEAMFPETMIVTGTDAAGAYRALVSKVSGDPTLGLKKPSELREKVGVEFLRLRVVQVGQPEAGGPSVLFHRGGRVSERVDLDSLSLERWADNLAEHLWYQAWPGGDGTGIKGTYEPCGGANGVRFADPRSKAIVALAMLRYSRSKAGIQGANFKERFDAMRHWLATLLDENEAVEPGEAEPWAEPASAALWWAMLDEYGIAPSKPSGGYQEVRDEKLEQFKRRCRDKLDQSLTEELAKSAEYGPILAWAANRREWNDDTDRKECEAFIRMVVRNTSPDRLVGTMPWLGWAGMTERGDVALREMRAELWQHQLQPESLPPEAQDLAGGVVFAASRQPLPTWQVARPLTYLAAGLRYSQVTANAEVELELARTLASLRFLRQLTASSAECHMYKDPAKALGGVRNSLFDQRMPPEATAMALLTVCETLKSLDAIKARAAAPSAAPKPGPEEAPKPAPK